MYVFSYFYMWGLKDTEFLPHLFANYHFALYFCEVVEHIWLSGHRHYASHQKVASSNPVVFT